jgi:hypothetical protein
MLVFVPTSILIFFAGVNPMRCLSLGARARGVALAALLVLTLAAPLAWTQVAGQEAAAVLDKKIMALAKDGSEIMTNLGYLSDIIGPRLTGSANLKRANEWTADKMKSYGLTNVKLEPWTIPIGWERGYARARFIEPNTGKSLLIASAGWSPGTNGRVEGDVVFLTAKNAEELKAYKGKLKNTIVLRNPPSTVAPINAAGDGQGRRGGGPGGAPGGAPGGRPGGFDFRSGRNFEEMMTFRRELGDFLKAEKAAVLVSDSAKPQGLLVTTGSWGGRGGDRGSVQDAIPSVYMAHEDYRLLHRLATRPGDARTRIEIEISNRFIPGPVAVYNTVGEIRGSEKPDEFVILGAHLDSWDLASGTTDNGTGTCIVLEAARLLAKSGIQPKRTIRFCLFSGEEQGLHGSRAYCQMHKEELPRISMALVHDTGTGKVQGIGLQGREILKPIFETELASLKEIGLTDINTRGMGGSDHASFEAAGVPGFAVQQDMTEYRFTHHTQTDTFDKVHEENLIQGAQILAVAAMRVANMDKLLPRDKPAQRERTPTPPKKDDAPPKKDPE